MSGKYRINDRTVSSLVRRSTQPPVTELDIKHLYVFPIKWMTLNFKAIVSCLVPVPLCTPVAVLCVFVCLHQY